MILSALNSHLCNYCGIAISIHSLKCPAFDSYKFSSAKRVEIDPPSISLQNMGFGSQFDLAFTNRICQTNYTISNLSNWIPFDCIPPNLQRCWSLSNTFNCLFDPSKRSSTVSSLNKSNSHHCPSQCANTNSSSILPYVPPVLID